MTTIACEAPTPGAAPPPPGAHAERPRPGVAAQVAAEVGDWILEHLVHHASAMTRHSR
jgi:hypothetical protein